VNVRRAAIARKSKRLSARWRLTVAAPFLAAFVSAAPLLAQSSAVLDSAERAADLGRVEEARELLDRWFASSEAAEREADVERARFLRARLTRDLDSARVDYLWVAVRGDVRFGAAARLRLAQLYVAEGRPDRAEENLERMRADYPGSPLEFESWLWTGNARWAAGDRAGACAAWETAASLPSGTGDESNRSLVRSALEDCRDSPAAGVESFSVQLGAFSSRETAEELRNRIVAAGHAARVLAPDEAGGLYRVRSGRFPGREEAARHAVRLTEAGFESIVVPGER
jgi:tetratricopeptide (TPR) repeat protein